MRSLINEINGSDLLYTLTFHVKKGGKREHVKTALKFITVATESTQTFNQLNLD